MYSLLSLAYEANALTTFSVFGCEGQANYIHSLASATSPHYMRAGGNLITVVRGNQCSINIHAHIQDTAEYSLDALPRLQLGATPQIRAQSA